MAVHSERIGDVSVVTISRPEARNAIDRATVEELLTAFAEFDADDSGALVVAGAAGVFGVGTEEASIDEIVALDLRRPTVAAIAGDCRAESLQLAMWCDLRVAGEDAVLSAGSHGIQRLSRLVGPSRAADLALTGRVMSGAEAWRIGLVDRLVPPDQELGAALDLAASVAVRPASSIEAALRAVRDR